MMFVEAVPQVTSIQCFSAWCGDPVSGVVSMFSIWATLIAGALIMPRWRDMFLVAAVVSVVVFSVEWMFAGPLIQHFQFADIWHIASAVSVSHGFALLYASVVHGLKRAALWLAGSRVASPS